MNIFQVFYYAAIVEQLQAGDSIDEWVLGAYEWGHMNMYMPLQFEGDKVFAAVLSAPLAIVEGDRTINDITDDLYFEETHPEVQR